MKGTRKTARNLEFQKKQTDTLRFSVADAVYIVVFKCQHNKSVV